MDLAKALTASCFAMYAVSPSGVSGDTLLFPGSQSFLTEVNDKLKVDTKSYLTSTAYSLASTFHLRPEVSESIFLLYRFTKDPMYLAWGWQIFKVSFVCVM
jgi:mannosyl-oligosaccharide alpha-1,2-mannosidase